MKRLLHNLTTVVLIAVLSFGVAPLLVPERGDAAFVTNRSIELISSAPSVLTQHRITFDYVTVGSQVGSVVFEYCENNPFIGDPCTIPAGLDVSGFAIASQSGQVGFSPHANTNGNTVVMTRVPAFPVAGQSIYLLDNIFNGSATNTTQFVRISTHTSIDGTGPAIDEGGLAYSLEDLFSVSATTPPFLEFCVGITITGHDCSTATGSIVSLGTFNENATRSGTSQMTAATNAASGYVISANGPTMTSGNNTINGVNPRSTSNQGTSQFGLNLRNNSNPNVGTNVFGPGVGGPTGDYGVLNQFKFNSGENIASAPNESNYRTYTVSYIVNIDPNETPGQYATTLTYIATATF